MQNQPAVLVLACGTIFHGISIGANGYGVGELVFNTSQLGYQEMLTDPSYAEQIITLTTAHVGNTGCNEDDVESSKIWAKGLVVRDSSIFASNYQKTQSLKDFLIKNHTVAIAGIDTRYLTQKLRSSGVIGACVSTDVDNIDKCLELAKNFAGLNGLDLAQNVTRQVTERWHEGLGKWARYSKPLQFHVVVYDFGVKNAILRILHDLGCYLTIVPAKTPVADVLQMSPDGVVLSNGPGDPSACYYAIAATKVLLEKNVPVFGICLGFQILALASGAKSIKMKFGHHGSNHPVIEIGGSKRVYITSQNHGFAIDENSLPENLTISHRSLFDNSLQGIIHKNKSAFGFQGHPEASPGPHDISGLFNKFVNLMMEYK
jgi:carbamoyl-phosphate synthase small subunit